VRNGSAPGNKGGGTEIRPASTRPAYILSGYYDQPESLHSRLKKPDMPLDQRVGRISLFHYRMQLRYHRFVKLGGIPGEAFNYRLGNRPALEDVVDPYRVKTGVAGL